jgi:hypothetical protein
MARKKDRRKRQIAQQRTQQRATDSQQSQDEAPNLNEPWLAKRTGLIIMTLLSLGIAAFMAWNLAPSEGIFRAILWGLGFAAAIWGIFGLSFAFNTWVRRRR